LVRVASSKAEFLKASASSQEECDAREADLAQQVVDLHVVRKRDLDGQWVQNRRLIMQRLHGSWKERDDAQDKLQENLAKKVRQLLRGSPERVADAVVLGEFTHQGLDRLRAKEDAAEEPREGGGSANDRYLAHFLAGTGRDPSDGALGAWSNEPAVTPEQESWDNSEWAKHFLTIGGFEPSPDGAATRDSDGWLPLHHAIQSTVHWSQGIAACRGLIDMMSGKRLQAKTKGGRPAGYTALHLACNGSDRIFQRHKIVELLLQRNADVNALDDKGRTPLHHAAGTGVLEAAKLLVEAGAVVDAVDDFGKNALDKCKGSSGTLYRSRMGGNLWVRELLV
jgi:hypothetical protein